MAQRPSPQQSGATPTPATSPLAPVGDAGPTGFGRALIRTARPKQWAKNALVFAAPAAAGVLDEGGPRTRTLLVFLAFCLAASGTYFLNDAADVEGDRRHPTKRDRPIAAGVLGRATAVVIGAVLLIGGIGLAALANWATTGWVAGYVALTVSYSLWLKHEPVVDLAAVAAGFVIRAIAGGVAAEVPLSNWFLIVAGGGSLFIVAGKRHGELHDVDLDSPGSTRAVLEHYSVAFLTFVQAVACGVTITAYCLWAFEKAAAEGGAAWFQASIVPMMLALLRYALVVDRGKGGAPEEIVLGDRWIIGLGFVWALLFALGLKFG